MSRSKTPREMRDWYCDCQIGKLRDIYAKAKQQSKRLQKDETTCSIVIVEERWVRDVHRRTLLQNTHAMYKLYWSVLLVNDCQKQSCWLHDQKAVSVRAVLVFNNSMCILHVVSPDIAASLWSKLLFISMQKCAEIIDEPIICHHTASDILLLVEGTHYVVIVRSLRTLLHFLPVGLARGDG